MPTSSGVGEEVDMYSVKVVAIFYFMPFSMVFLVDSTLLNCMVAPYYLQLCFVMLCHGHHGEQLVCPCPRPLHAPLISYLALGLKSIPA